MNDVMVADQNQGDMLERVIAFGDLSKLTPSQRTEYYRAVCESLGLNPLTRPFEYIELDGKLTLYARKDATDQLRDKHRISVTIASRERVGDVYVVTAHATTADGRTDESTGVVPLVKEDGEWKTSSSSNKRYFAGNGKWIELRGSNMANAMMLAETKAKRRVTLSICGLGWTDETEVDSIPNARPVLVRDDGVIDTPELPPATKKAELPASEVKRGLTVDTHWTENQDSCDRFWNLMSLKGLSSAEVYEALGVETLSDFKGDKKAAVAAINAYTQSQLAAASTFEAAGPDSGDIESIH